MVGGAVDDRLGENTMSEFAGRYQRLSVRTPGSVMWSTPGCRSLSPSWRSLRVGRCTTRWSPAVGRRPRELGGCLELVPRLRQLVLCPGWARTAAVVGDPGFERPTTSHPLIDHP
jgi:hypothetical protein